jgi:hypothetical protein
MSFHIEYVKWRYVYINGYAYITGFETVVIEIIYNLLTSLKLVIIIQLSLAYYTFRVLVCIHLNNELPRYAFGK